MPPLKDDFADWVAGGAEREVGTRDRARLRKGTVGEVRCLALGRIKERRLRPPVAEDAFVTDSDRMLTFKLSL